MKKKLDNQNKKLIEGLQRIARKKQQISSDLKFISNLQKKYLKKRNKKIRNISISISTAAIILLSLFVLSPSFAKMDYSELFLQWYEPLNSDIKTRDNSNDFSPLNRAVNLYNQQKYEDSYNILDSLMITDPDNSTILLYKSLIDLEKKRIDSAKEGFSKIISFGGAFEVHAHWYLYLISILEVDPEMARKHIRALKKMPDKPYYEKFCNTSRRLRFRKTK